MIGFHHPIPLVMGEQTYYSAHGTTFRLKRLAWDCWYLENVATGRARFGNRAEIEEDIDYTFTAGALPRSRGPSLT